MLSEAAVQTLQGQTCHEYSISPTVRWANWEGKPVSGNVHQMCSPRCSKNMEILDIIGWIMVQLLIPYISWLFSLQGSVWSASQDRSPTCLRSNYTKYSGWLGWAQRASSPVLETTSCCCSKQNESHGRSETLQSSVSSGRHGPTEIATIHIVFSSQQAISQALIQVLWSI